MKTFIRLNITRRTVSLLVVGIAILGLSLMTGLSLAQNERAKPKPAAAGAIKSVHRLGLRPGDLLLESVREFIREKDIRDGAVLTGIGSLSECQLHWPKKAAYPPENEFRTFKGVLEITGIQGIIADGEPHLHISLAEHGDARTMGGHLEDGGKVLYLVELTIAEFAGTPMTRRPNQHNVKMLQVK